MDFAQHLKTYLSDDEIHQLMDSLNEPAKHAALLNIRKMSDEKFLSLFPHVVPHPIVPHAYLYDKNEYDLGKSIYHTLGCFYLQEPSAMIPSHLLNPKPGETVLDLCAAPGGKSVQASFLMNNKGVIISNDIARNRCSAILENVERLGIGNIVITNNDFSKIYHNYKNYFDRIILDAPCSGSGMFRKENKMAEDWSYNKVIKYQEVQKELIIMAYQMLKLGGTMVYSTCSFSYEEDEEVIKHLLDNTDAQIVEIPENAPFYANKKNPLGIHLLPFLFPGEGHYVCLIKKPGIIKSLNSTHAGKNIKNVLEIKKCACTYVTKFGNTLFGYDKEFLNKGLSIIRLGVKIGEKIGDFIRYDYHYSHFVDTFIPTFSLNFTELEKYFKGETLTLNCPKGYLLLQYDGINVDITKSDIKTIKNHLPKSLRRYRI